MSEWEVVYKKAIGDDGELFFPERLNHVFLNQAKRHMGTQKFFNQYQNEVLGSEDKPFKKEWIKYYDALPENVHIYAYIDPAISQKDDADFTALIVLAVDYSRKWYVIAANRYKITPSEIIDKIFEVTERFNPLITGIESIAFQEALVYMCHEQMQARNIMVPIQGIKTSNQRTKEMKILSLVPRFEWGDIYFRHGLMDLEAEYLDYAGERSKHDDLMDALASIDEIISYPTQLKKELKDVPSNHPDYERWYRQKLANRNKQTDDVY